MDERWSRYTAWRSVLDAPEHDLQLELDLADANMDAAGFVGSPGAALTAGLSAMEALEAGAVANVDERRQVGHYWLRAPALAPAPEITRAIEASWRDIAEFTARVHSGELRGGDGQPFERLLLIGIGGSALGPQLVADALGGPGDRLALDVIDNTDPVGFERALARGRAPLARTLVAVVSKSGSTVETRNGMREAMHAYAARSLDFGAHAIAITGAGSTLDALARGEDRERATRTPWLARFPLWSWVGGRTSVCSPVGLVPMALLGLDWRGLLAGAARMDQATRDRDLRRNPATLLARMWHQQTGGHGARAMVVLPYRDPLVLLSRYLQQLVMESLGKRLDRAGEEVWQGLTVFGNKGSTDQHAYVQQLRDGLDDFFALFVRVLEEPASSEVEVAPGVRSADCLDGFYLGTRAALAERGRASATLVLERLNAPALGAVIALFERSVGLYAELLNLNAYHQPGVEAGKRAASGVLELQGELLAALAGGGAPRTARELARELSADALTTWQILRRLSRGRRGVARVGPDDPDEARFHGLA